MVPVSYPENSTITPCEILETQAPILFHCKELWPDSGGPGRCRGGLGQIIVFEHVGHDPMTFNLTPDRITTRPQGLDGGRPGLPGHAFINGTEIFKFPAIQLRPGDVVELQLGGGGGFGPVGDRPEEAILRDVALGYVSPAGATDDYGLEESADLGTAPETDTVVA
jgi:N-methylhydantoinase B